VVGIVGLSYVIERPWAQNESREEAKESDEGAVGESDDPTVPFRRAVPVEDT
jgi:hypothetical protein